MSTLNNKQNAINSIVSGTSSVLGFIHASATTIADLSLKAELNINARYRIQEDGSKLTTEDLIQIAEQRIKKSDNFQYKLGTKKQGIADLDLSAE